EDTANQVEADEHGEHGRRGREEQPEPLGSTEVEGLVPAFSGEDVGHADFSLLEREPLTDSLRTKIWRATFSPSVRRLPSTCRTMGPSNGCFSRTSTRTPGCNPRVSRKATMSGSVEPEMATTATSPASS